MTSAVHADAAATAGADAVGMVFYDKATRRISTAIAEQIIAVIPPFVTPIGLFVNSPATEILRTARVLGLRAVQLHGDETPELVAQLDGLSVVKAIRADPLHLESALDRWRQANRGLPAGRLVGILLETSGTAEPGGTGVENDWSLLETAQNNGWLAGLPPLIVAGGLTPENVGDVIRRLRPYAVDVSSGIEKTRGVKSVDRMRAFSAAVARAV
jgi:phosphoribosylanthranilate isomerase